MRNCRNKITDALVALCVMICAACTNEWDEEQTGMILRENEVALQWLPANMAIQHVKTRVSDPKTAEEQQINNVHVFIFGSDGDYLKPEESDAIQGYRYLSDVDNVVLNTDLFGNQEAAKNATIVVLANIPEDTFHDTDGNSYPDEITNLESFNSFTFNLPTWTATLPETGLPMYGKVEHDLSSTSANKIVMVQLQSMMARIDLDFTMVPDQQSPNNEQWPALEIEQVLVGNFPEGCTIDPQLDPVIGTNQAEVTSGKNGAIRLCAETEIDASGFTGQVLREGNPQSLTLYMFEHARTAKVLSEVVLEDGTRPFPDGEYPEGIQSAEQQRYKKYLADEEAAYIKLKGRYTNHNGYPYAVTYTLHIGADAVDDFTIKHNRQYKHNITVTGITVNNMGAEALLDTRVDIDSEENPYFIEMLREREFDAHFNVTPMDVYIYRGGSIKVEIKDPTDDWWVRMEPMIQSQYNNEERRAYAVTAGEGKRNYFTTDLVTSELKDNTSYTVTSTDATETYEERIYFYIDENVPQYEHQNGEDVDSREATIVITYTSPNGESESREVILRQSGMKAVYFNKFSQGTYNYGRQAYWFYIEDYEEYLEHYDGKNEYTDTYEGFKWGLDGLRSDLGVGYWQDFYQYMSWGWKNTMQIMEKYRNSNLWREHEMTLNEDPSGAAEYCYNKNKRNEYGNVSEARWYLPTISELEYALERYYTDYEVFQDKWYWSSNPGAAGNNGDSGENPEYARATRIKYEPNNDEANDAGFVHYRSNPDYPYDYDTSTNPSKKGLGGHAKRSEEFRIRAAYIYKEPYDSYTEW